MTTAAERAEARFRTIAATLVALWGFTYLLGVTWDIQWHTDVGPDTFWTKSHLFFYSGAAFSGLTCLWVAIATTLKHRRGEAVASADTTTPILGFLRAPVGFLISGLGALSFLLSGLFDLWWHEMFGFDITLMSPPHFGLLLSGVTICVGAVYAFASEANRAAARGEGGLFHPASLGALFSLALLLTQFSLFYQIPLEMFTFVGPVVSYPLITALVFGVGLMAAASFLPRLGSATMVGLLYLAVRTALLYLVPPLVRWELGLEHLTYRENHIGAILPSIVPFIAPMLVFVAGMVIDLAMMVARRYGLNGRLVVWVTAALAFMVNTLVDQRWAVYYNTVRSHYAEHAWEIDKMMTQFNAALLPTVAVTVLVGALAGWLGWNVGISLRTTRQ